MAGEFDLLIGASFLLNIGFFMVFQKVQSFWTTQGMKNFFNQQILASFNRIKNPKLVVGANASRFAPIYFAGDNEPIYPDPTNKEGLPLQFEPKNIFHGPRGINVIFAQQGSLSNVNPLENASDDIELSQMGQATLKFINIEAERKYQKDNPFNKISRMLFLHGAVMLVCFLVLGFILLNIQTIATTVQSTIAQYSPIAQKILAHPEQFGLPANLVGNTPSSPPPSNVPSQLIPGVI